MKKRQCKHIFLFILILLSSLAGYAQIPVLADQFIVDPFQTNPAFAGTSRSTPIYLSARQQWIGIQAAPSAQLINGHVNLKARQSFYNPKGFLNRGDNSYGKVGVGGGIFNYSYGAFRQTGIHLAYSYHVFVGDGRLSLGLAPSMQQFNINKSDFIFADEGDPLIINQGSENLYFVDANAGMHYYQKNYYFGVSVIQLFGSSVKFGDLSYQPLDDFNANPHLSRTLYSYFGYKIMASDQIQIEPSVLVKYNQPEQLKFQLNARMYLFETFQAGVSWKYQESLSFFFGTTIGNMIFKYFFEAPYGAQMFNQYTSHQVLVGTIIK